MSFQEEKRKSIKRYMLEKIRQDDEMFIQKTTDNFQISITTVKRYIAECLAKDIIRKDEEKKAGYMLVAKTNCFEYELKEGLCEDKIFYEDVARVLPLLSRNLSP